MGALISLRRAHCVCYTLRTEARALCALQVLQLQTAAGHRLLDVQLRANDIDDANALPTRVLLLRTSPALFNGVVGCYATHGDASAAGGPAVPISTASAPYACGDRAHGYPAMLCVTAAPPGLALRRVLTPWVRSPHGHLPNMAGARATAVRDR